MWVYSVMCWDKINLRYRIKEIPKTQKLPISQLQCYLSLLLLFLKPSSVPGQKKKKVIINVCWIMNKNSKQKQGILIGLNCAQDSWILYFTLGPNIIFLSREKYHINKCLKVFDLISTYLDIKDWFLRELFILK